LSKDKKWWLVGEQLEIVKEIKYLGVVLDSGSKEEKERKHMVIRGT
jgi:hypothetical protein